MNLDRESTGSLSGGCLEQAVAKAHAAYKAADQIAVQQACDRSALHRGVRTRSTAGFMRRDPKGAGPRLTIRPSLRGENIVG